MSTRDRQREQWLQEALGAPADALTPASSDASFRRYFRIQHDGRSRIVMDAPPPQEDCRPFVQVSRLLDDAGLQVPKVFSADLEQGFLLLSDLGDEVYLNALNDGSADTLYLDALRALVQMQADADASTLPAYDRAKLLQEMQLFPDWFLNKHLGLECTAREAGVLSETFDFLVANALEQPQVFVHRDYHSRNLMLLQTGGPGILDYQDAVLGPVAYDLVSLLRDVYVRWPIARVEHWVDQYHELASAAGVLGDVPPAQLRRWFDLIGVQRHLKVAGIFARLYYRDGKSGYLRDIALTLDYLSDVAGRYPQLQPLLALLAEHDVGAVNEQRVDTIIDGLQRADG